ncbi:MAG: EpsI family protein [Gemmataceae bacterium]|nr:EpsI family protein [Gemmataceae bacterium]
MFRFAILGLAAAALLIDGYVHGRWTERWGASVDAELAAQRLHDVPMRIGDWQGHAKDPLDDREVEQAGFRSHFIRVYTNRRTGAAVTVLLACGNPGPISVHTPDVCYRGSGFQIMKAQEQCRSTAANGTAAGELWKCQFGKPDSTSPVQLRVFWSWNSKGAWLAPTNPRFTFAGAAALYKLYVIHELIPNDPRSERIGTEFLTELLPQLNDSLFRRDSDDGA